MSGGDVPAETFEVGKSESLGDFGIDFDLTKTKFCVGQDESSDEIKSAGVFDDLDRDFEILTSLDVIAV